MRIIFSEIETFLTDNEIHFTAVNADENKSNDGFQFASTKCIINKGFYFLTHDYLHLANAIQKSVILTDSAEGIKTDSNTYIVLDDPQRIHYKLAALQGTKLNGGVHEMAIISEKAKIAKSAYIGPFCILDDCIIEENVQLLGNVTIRDNVTIKKNTIIEGNSVIGARGMAWIWDTDGTRIMQPQVGGVVIGENCIIGTDISIVKGSLTESTSIGDHTIIAHGTKIGHGCQVDSYVHMANNVSLAGNARIGHRTFLGSACTISSNVKIAPNCIVGAGAVVNKSMTQEYATIVGVPAKILKIDNFENKPKGAPKPYKK